MRISKVTCDGCGRDLTSRTNMVDYRLRLTSEDKPGYGAGAYTAMGIYPSIDRDFHFCALRCLDHWRSRENHEAALWKSFYDKWKEEHGTNHDNGRGGVYYSTPGTPDELHKRNKIEFAAAALEAFPMDHSVRDPAQV